MKLTMTAAIAILTAATAFAQPSSKATTRSSDPTSGPTTATTATAPAEEGISSEQMRNEFSRILEHYPPEVGKVLKLDPTLLSNPGYLATYPEVAAFVAEHPQVAHSPRYFLEGVSGFAEVPAETAGMRMWRSVFEGISIFSVMTLIAFVMTWLIRTVIDHRRWSRLSKVQAEVHNKLLDRFTSNDELLTYIQTPAGKRFLESAPIQLDAAPRQLAAPFGRILWSIQSGVVLAAAGLGFQLVSHRIEKDIAQPMYAIGIIAIAVGLGFVVSAIISFFVSRHLGLFASAATEATE